MITSTVLVLKNFVDTLGWRAFLVRILGLHPLNVILIALLFSVSRDSGLSVERLASDAIYFVPLLALSSAIGSWETELTQLIGEEYLLHPRAVIPTRLAMAFIDTVFPVTVFFVFMIVSNSPLIVMVVSAAHWVSFALLGAAIGYARGFVSEKSVNNFLNASTWVLGFGPGPFMGLEVKAWQFAFPGAQSLTGDYAGELLKCAIIAAGSIAWIAFAVRPRRERFFGF